MVRHTRSILAGVNAGPFLVEIALTLEGLHFDVVLIGRAPARKRARPR
jgi:hypothetical protein